MKPVYTSICLVLTLAGLANAQPQQDHPTQQAQPATTTSPSLGELARQLKLKREKALTKPKTVFTNDNMPVRPPEEGPTAAGGIATPAGEPATTSAEPVTGAPPSGEPKPETKAQGEAVSATAAPEVHDEKYYRTKMKDLETQLDLHQRQLSVLQQKTGQNQMQFYADPQKTLNQEFTRADINKLTQDIDKKKQDIAADYDAMDALRDQLRREGGDPGWVRTGPEGATKPEAPAPARETGTAKAPPPAKPTEPTPAIEKPEDKVKTRDYWQAKLKPLTAELTKAQEYQQTVEDELRLLQIQQAREIVPEAQAEVAQKISAKQQDLEASRALTAKAQKALDDLEKEFKDSGAPEEWLKAD